MRVSTVLKESTFLIPFECQFSVFLLPSDIKTSFIYVFIKKRGLFLLLARLLYESLQLKGNRVYGFNK